MEKSVTSILRNNGRILILKRSGRVRYHKGCWGGVSGYMELGDEMDERAIIEIEEETGLNRNEIKLAKKGAPFVVADASIGTEFLVHPYLFDVSADKITIDWEHTEYRWIHPEELKEYGCVPGLGKVLEAVGL